MCIGLTYMDIKRREKKMRDDKENAKGIIGAIVLFLIYAFVSTMDYQDCVRGAVSC
tara:strand:- start:7114 stop:7281 length:168 start_codon:yes stop_codon:yes gene_type:complete